MERVTPNGARRVYRLLCDLAWADGEVAPRERAWLDAFLARHGIERVEAAALEAQGRGRSQLGLSKRPEEQALLLRSMAELVQADGVITPGERRRARAFARTLGLTPAAVEAALGEVPPTPAARAALEPPAVVLRPDEVRRRPPAEVVGEPVEEPPPLEPPPAALPSLELPAAVVVAPGPLTVDPARSIIPVSPLAPDFGTDPDERRGAGRRPPAPAPPSGAVRSVLVSDPDRSGVRTLLLREDGARVELPRGLALELDPLSLVGTWRIVSEDGEWRNVRPHERERSVAAIPERWRRCLKKMTPSAERRGKAGFRAFWVECEDPQSSGRDERRRPPSAAVPSPGLFPSSRTSGERSEPHTGSSEWAWGLSIEFDPAARELRLEESVDTE